ncbi:hypothetical protein [Actinomadura sp. DC4]|nr:hypothetical protein [Actinomadura sp. DC4]MDN3358007.1 hypothetical protein [Actinomadura sp. DC4]
MSHLRRAVALIILAMMGWFLAFGSIGAGITAASAASTTANETVPIACC